MAWQPVAARFIRRGGPTLLYCETGPLESGDLQLWLDSHGRVVGFHLSHARAPRQPHYSVEWHQGRALRVGEVDSGEQAAERARSFKMSPLIRSSARPVAQILEQLIEYFERSSGLVEPSQRDAVRSILLAALEARRGSAPDQAPR